MNDKRLFIKAMLENPMGVGAIAPSSKALVQQMIEGISPNKDEIILELGVGTGAVTGAIAEILPDFESYLGVEIDPRLTSYVQEQFPNLNIVNIDACGAFDLHKKLKMGSVRYILSGIPFVLLPKDVSKKIFDEIGTFMEGGCEFRTFQYVHGYYSLPAKRLRSYMSERFGTMHKSPVVMRNIPPAVVLTWKNSRPDTVSSES